MRSELLPGEEVMSNYDDAVGLAAAALMQGEEANWQLARLTYENTLSLGEAASQTGKATMAQWSADVRAASGRRFSPATGGLYRQLWAEFGQEDLMNRPPWPEAIYKVRPATAPDRMAERLANKHLREASSERKAEIARGLLADPEVAAQIENEIVEHVASDATRTAHVISRRRESEPVREIPEKPLRDYDALTETHVNGLSVILAAESSGKWVPDERSSALLYFLTQILGNRQEPTGEMNDLVAGRLESMFAEVEAFANSETS